MTVKNGLYSIRIEMKDGGRGHASGIIVLIDGQILGGDTHFHLNWSRLSEQNLRVDKWSLCRG